MEKVVMGGRLLMGLIFVVFGLNGFLQFIPMPQPTIEAESFFMALMETGYFLPLLKVTEIVCGIFLLVGIFVPLALVILAPIIIHILCFHLFLDMNGLPMAIFLTLNLVFLACKYKKHYEGLFKMKAQP